MGDGVAFLVSGAYDAMHFVVVDGDAVAVGVGGLDDVARWVVGEGDGITGAVEGITGYVYATRFRAR